MSLIKRSLYDMRRFGISPSILQNRLFGRTPDCGVFFTSQPKSGTHLLERVLCLMPGLYRPLMRTLNEHNLKYYGGFNKALGRISQGKIMVTHLHYRRDFADTLIHKNIKSFLLTRDPRSMVISYIHYVKKNRHHNDHNAIMNLDIHSAVDFLIDKNNHGHKFKFIDNMSLFTAWADHPEFRVVKFEDLIGLKRLETIMNVAKHCNISLTRLQIEDIASKVVSTASPTFRSGKTDEWKIVLRPDQIRKIEYLTSETMEAFDYY